MSRSKIRTPWGEADYSCPEIPGITRHDTPSHGGLHCDRSRNHVIRKCCPSFVPWAKGPWYEEDADWCIPVLVFWREYQAMYIAEGKGREKNLWYAVQTATRDPKYYGVDVIQFIAEQPELLEYVAQWDAIPEAADR